MFDVEHRARCNSPADAPHDLRCHTACDLCRDARGEVGGEARCGCGCGGFLGMCAFGLAELVTLSDKPKAMLGMSALVRAAAFVPISSDKLSTIVAVHLLLVEAVLTGKIVG